MLSFLVTYYNQQDYVSRSLNSIFKQNLTDDFEVLVGDDGSSDDTVSRVEEFQKKYPRKIKIFIQPREQKNYLSVIRASQNRLNLLLHAGGEYVCFLDGDDEYCDFDFAQQAVDELKKNPAAVGVAHNHVDVAKDGEKKLHHNITDRDFITLKDYAKNLYIHVGAIIFRRPKPEELSEIIKLQAFDDNNITYFFLNRGNLLYRNIDVYSYHSNENSICSSADVLEMKLLNAVDYAVIKKIIQKAHFTLFLRYFDTRFYVYKNRNLLDEQKYQKWKAWAMSRSIDYMILEWKELSVAKKVSIKFVMHIQKIFVAFLYGQKKILHEIRIMPARCSHKIKKMIKKFFQVLGVLL